MQYCIRCAYPENHALGITFNTYGLCSGCIIHQEKDRLNWQEREEKLVNILENYRDTSGLRHDCIIPVSGGKDSFFIVDLIKNKFGLNPLLITYNRHYNTRGGIYNLEQIRTAIGCDIIAMTLKAASTYRLMRYSLEKIGSIHWPYLAGSTVFPIQMAVKKKIPLIIWGAHQGVDQVGMFSHLDEVEMTRRYRKEHDLLGVEPEDILAEGDDLVQDHDLLPLLYPSDIMLHDIGVRGIYLNNYIRWDTKAQHEAMHKKYDIYAAPQLRTFDTYNDVDCQIYNRLHDIIKYRKFSYSKINDHVAREIRFGRLSFEQGVELIDLYQNQDNVDISFFTKTMKISTQDLWNFVDAHQNIKPAPITLTTEMIESGRLNIEHKNPMQFLTHLPEEIVEAPESNRLLMRGGIAA